MKSEKTKFLNNAGEELSAVLEWPEDEQPLAFAIFAHCFTCTKNIAAAVNISRALSQKRIAVLRFDFTGLGESAGEFETTTFSQNVVDLVAASRYLSDRHRSPEILIGHSLGGAAVLHAAHQIPSINAVVTIGAPYHPQHALHLFEVAVEEIKQSGEAVVEIAGRKFMVRQTLLEDLKAQDPKEPIEKLSASLLIMHSPRDTVVGIENAAQIYKTAKHPKSFISLEPADHLLSNKQDSLYAADMIASWAKRYLDMPGRRDMQKDVEDNRVTVRTSADGFRTDMFVGDHALVADEPKKFGGTNQGPSPYDYLQAALGACTSMTLRMYAEKKAWPLHSCVVRLHYEKVHAVDCSDCDNPQNKIDRFVREIELMGPLNPEQCQKLLEIADKCPVHRTLANQVTIETRLIGCQEQTKK